MLRSIGNIFKIPDLRNKILFTIALLCIYRIGFHIPVPGFDQEGIFALSQDRDSTSPLGRVTAYLQMFSGGTLSKSSLFGLGIMPYISASIILMLLGEILPSLRKLRQEGAAGHKKIQEYTRYLTVPLCIVQAMMIMKMMGGNTYPGLKVPAFAMGILGMTAGTLFLMWLGEQIDEYGIGNGISLIIMAGIVSRMPWAIKMVWDKAELRFDAPAHKGADAFSEQLHRFRVQIISHHSPYVVLSENRLVHGAPSTVFSVLITAKEMFQMFARLQASSTFIIAS